MGAPSMLYVIELQTTVILFFFDRRKRKEKHVLAFMVIDIFPKKSSKISISLHIPPCDSANKIIVSECKGIDRISNSVRKEIEKLIQHQVKQK